MSARSTSRSTTRSTARSTARSGVPAFTVGRSNPPSLRDVADPKTVDRAFEALANGIRRGILAALHDQGGFMSSHEIASRFDISWQGISRHLRILTAAGLIDCDVRRNERAYTLNRSGLKRVPGRWITRVATEGTRDKEGRLVFDFEE